MSTRPSPRRKWQVAHWPLRRWSILAAALLVAFFLVANANGCGAPPLAVTLAPTTTAVATEVGPPATATVTQLRETATTSQPATAALPSPVATIAVSETAAAPSRAVTETASPTVTMPSLVATIAISETAATPSRAMTETVSQAVRATVTPSATAPVTAAATTVPTVTVPLSPTTATATPTPAAQAIPSRPTRPYPRPTTPPTPAVALEGALPLSPSNNTPALGGRGEPDTVMRIYDDDAFLGEAMAAADGVWFFVPQEPLAAGRHNLRIVPVDEEGNEQRGLAVMVVIAPGATSIEPLSLEGLPGEPEPGRVTLTGKALPGLLLMIHDDGRLLTAMTIRSDGTWRYVLPQTLPPGVHPFWVVLTDRAGRQVSRSARTPIEVALPLHLPVTGADLAH